MGMAMMSVRIREMTFMPTVRGRRSIILSSTGRPSADMDRPKSRRTRRESQSRYCTCRGLSRPYRASSRWRAASPARGLRFVSISVGEPGARWMTQKLMRVIPHKTSSIHSSLRTMRNVSCSRAALRDEQTACTHILRYYSVRVIHCRMSATSCCHCGERRSWRKRAYRLSSRPRQTSIR